MKPSMDDHFYLMTQDGDFKMRSSLSFKQAKSRILKVNAETQETQELYSVQGNYHIFALDESKNVLYLAFFDEASARTKIMLLDESSKKPQEIKNLVISGHISSYGCRSFVLSGE